MNKDKESNISRLKNWTSIHIKELDDNNQKFNEYLELYSKTDNYKFKGNNFPFFIFSTGHTGSLWVSFLFQILNPDNMVCFHDHETVHAWSEFRFSKFEEKSWNYLIDSIDKIKNYESREKLENLSPNLSQHIENELARYPIVGYCLTGIINFYYEIMIAAENSYKNSKTVCLTRNGLQVVNSLFYNFLSIIPEYYKIPYLDNKIKNLKNEFFVLLFKDPLLNKHILLFNEVKKTYPEYDLFIFCCIIWNGIYDRVITDFSKNKEDKFVISRLEDIITGKKHITELYGFLLGDIYDEKFFDYTVEFVQSMDINKKIKDKQPESIWLNQWDKSQREIFKIICSKMMNYFNYEIPSIN